MNHLINFNNLINKFKCIILINRKYMDDSVIDIKDN